MSSDSSVRKRAAEEALHGTDPRKHSRTLSAASLSHLSDVADRTLQRIFASLDSERRGVVRSRTLLSALKQAGLARDDPRLWELMEGIEEAGGPAAELDFAAFKSIVSHNVALVEKALTGHLAVPDFPAFCAALERVYRKVLPNRTGANAAYIPQLAAVDPEQFGVALCTVDGQFFEVGDARTLFCIQSCCKPLNYALAVAEHGLARVHHHVGREPSGRSFNKLVLKPVGEPDALDAERAARGLQPRDAIPHNPMINAGAIMCCSLVQPDRTLDKRIEHVTRVWERLSTGKVGVSAPVFLSERATADRNFCLGYMMRENGAFMPSTDVSQTLELYFQCCSIEMHCRQMAVAAATLANGGVNPLTSHRVFDPPVVRACLSLMLSCGMYDYSGEWAFRVGLPAKSGVGGAVFVVLPNLGGLCIWSPRLDNVGNSVRGVAFCQELVREFNLHHFDCLRGIAPAGKRDKTRRPLLSEQERLIGMLFAAARGDLVEMRVLLASGADVNSYNYDRRTALHVAAAEGWANVVAYLLTHGANVNAKDRWGSTPLADAHTGSHAEVIRLLEAAGGVRSDPEMDHARR